MVRSLSSGYVMSSCTFTLPTVRLCGTSMVEVVNTSGKSTRWGTSAAWNTIGLALGRERSSRHSSPGRRRLRNSIAIDGPPSGFKGNGDGGTVETSALVSEGEHDQLGLDEDGADLRPD